MFGTSSISARRRFGAKLKPASMRLPKPEPLSDLQGYGLALFVSALATGLGFAMHGHVAESNIVMAYLLGITYVATRTTPKPAALASLLGVACFDFFFVHPRGTFAVADVQYVLTFGVMLLVSLLISTLTVRLREQSSAKHSALLHAQIEQARGDLLSAVSHDLRTPLASIEGSAGVLVEQPELSENSRQLASTIREESARLSHLVRNLLDMTRVQGSIDLNPDWYALDELVANAILRTEELFDRPTQLKVVPNVPLVRVDGVLIELVLVNLLENASRHAGRSAQVVVEIARTGGKVLLSVRNNGPAIPGGQLESIFERFHGSKGKGAGLGLAICRAAIEAHSGRIWAVNESGGPKFVVELPEAEEDQDA